MRADGFEARVNLSATCVPTDVLHNDGTPCLFASVDVHIRQ